MPNPDPFYAYKEVRLDLDSSTQGSSIAIRLPAHGASTWASRTAQKRPHDFEIPVAEDEETFKQRYLATAASIYHRIYHQSPRSFLWRVLEDGKVLSIRVVDVSRQQNAADAPLTLRLSFPSRIVPACIAFSDSGAHDVLSVFVLTESRHIYTLSLRPDFFRKPSSTEDNVGDWCKSCSLSAFAFKTAHRLVALAADLLMLSFTDGSLLKAEKKSGSDGSEWKETHMNEGGWSLSLRSMIPLQGRSSIDLSTATAIASPITLLDSSAYVFTVTLDHRLRIWNLSSGKIAYAGDLLGQELDEDSKQVIEATNSQLVKVYTESETKSLCVTYSPLGSGQFKFWNVSSANGSLDITDLFPSSAFQPQIPTAGVWTLTDFAVLIDTVDSDVLTLWTLWKFNTTHRVQKLEFRIGSEREAQSVWRKDWQSMASEAFRSPVLPSFYHGEPSDVTDQWLEFILSPGTFTTATIETALAIYADTPNQKYSSKKNASLAERMCGFIGSSTTLARPSSERKTYEQFRTNIHKQWLQFYHTLLVLDTQRGEALSMVIDSRGGMPWIALADGMIAVRDCSSLERIQHNENQEIFSGVQRIAARLIWAVDNFHGAFSEQFWRSCKTSLLEEIFTGPSFTDPVRMRSFYDSCDFVNQIGDEEYSDLVRRLGGGFKDVDPDVCQEVLQQMMPSDDMERGAQLLPLAAFGNKLVLKGVQQIVEAHRSVCSDFLILLVLIEVEVNHGEDGLQFQTAAFFRQLIIMLKRLELINWLASTQIALPLAKNERSNSVTEKSPKKQIRRVETITVLEGVLRHLWGLDIEEGESMSKALTEMLLTICAPDSEFEAPTAVIQCYLLKHERTDLAMEFSRFGGQDPFSTYIQGRVHLAADEPEAAAALFKKAAFGISYRDVKQRTDHRSAGYLDETERNSLNAGLPEYYAHIVSLYDEQRIFSFVIDFARLALQFINHGSQDPQHKLLRTEMHSRLFSSAIQIAHFDIAYSTLALFTDQALQLTSLRTLVTKMCEMSYASHLVDLPFVGLQDKVDEILTQKCQSIVDVNAGVPYHKILYAWRIRRGDFRGAAAISLESLQRLQASGDGDRVTGDDELETPVTKQYVALINALSCVDPKQAWILSEELPAKIQKGGSQPKRKVVTLQDVRKDYQGELDRIAAIANDQFALASADEMDLF